VSTETVQGKQVQKDKDGVFKAAGDLDTACENCHQTF
jgi:cytochrome c556